MSGTILTGLLDRKNGAPCPVCGVIHMITNPCGRPEMTARIQKLLEATAMIPAILQANKEATTLAEGFRHIVKKADEAHGLLIDVLNGHGDIGKQILQEYLERLDTWAKEETKEPTSQDTSDQPALFDQEHLTPNAIKISDSTKLQHGLILDGDFSR